MYYASEALCIQDHEKTYERNRISRKRLECMHAASGEKSDGTMTSGFPSCVIALCYVGQISLIVFLEIIYVGNPASFFFFILSGRVYVITSCISHLHSTVFS